MPEELEDSPAQPFDMERYRDIVRRRHMLFLCLLLLGWGLVWGGSWLLPPRYKSSTLILVQPPSMPRNYVEPNVSDSLQSQIQSITQQMTSRTRLLRIVDKLNLYNDKNNPLSLDQKVAEMRKDIEIELVRDPQDHTIDAFRVSYTASDPHTAQQVTGELTNLFIHETSSVRQQQSNDTTQFLQSELQIARLNLAKQDAKVRAFQTAHEGSLPTQQASNLQILSGFQSQLQNEQDALNAARQQLVYHQSMAEQYSALAAAPRTADGAPSSLAGMDRQLETLRSKLANLRSRYTDQYPEVQDVEAEISRAEKARQQLIASLKERANTKSQTSSPADLADPGLNASMLQLQSQVKADELQIATREQAIRSLKSKIAEYQARLNNQPAVEQQLADLTRGYQQSQENYNDLLKKVSDSQMATNMEQLQAGGRFSMIDPPSLPFKPDSPNRLKMCVAGIGAGLGLGVLAVALLELLDDRLYNDKDIQSLLPGPVVCEIPEIMNAADEKRARRRASRGWAMAAAVTVAILAGAAFTFLKA